MSATFYHQVYKCRKCGEEFKPVKTHNFDIAIDDMNNLIGRINGERIKYRPLAPILYEQHCCRNGDLGVADFIGYEKEEQ